MSFPAPRPNPFDARIFVIDDDPNCVRGLLISLQREGYTAVSGTSDPRTAVAQVLAAKPELVLLDWHMEQVSGLEILKTIQREFPEAEVPSVIVLTGDAFPETKCSALEAGASDFLTKPWDMSEVVLRLRNHLRLRILQRRVQSENTRLESMVEERTTELRGTLAELKEVQAQVIADERMRALATMAAGVAHDFNNALMVICGYSELYSHPEESKVSREDLQEGFATIALASRDAKEIVRRLREFYRPFSHQNDYRQPVVLNQMVKETILLAKPRWEIQSQANSINIDITTDFQEMPEISVMPSELREVLLNLILNAVDAMPQGGTIALRTRFAGGRATIEIEDSGIGMTPETARRCMEPFYTTKGERGTGLGLAIAYGIVHRHEGTLEIDSQVNRGTRIRITLPEKSEQPALPPSTAPLPVDKHLRILVVDDDPQICSVLSRFLEADGHSVKVAANGCEALDKFVAGEVDLVIADRVMPKMSGDQLAVAIHEIQPGEPIILLTGFEARSVPADVNLLVNKPASMSSLREAISRVMAA